MNAKRKKKAKRKNLTASRRDRIHALAVGMGIAACKELGLGPAHYPKAIAATESGLIKRFKEGNL